MKQLLYRIVIGSMLIGQIYAQSEEKQNLSTDRPDNIDLTFTRGFLLVTNEEEGVPLNAGSSGTIRIGAAFKVHLANNTFGFRVHPSISWTKFTYDQTAEKTFPTAIDSSMTLDVEKHRFTFVDLPLGIFVNITKDEDGDSRFFVEAGGFVGYRTSSIYKTKYNVPNENQEVRQRVRGVKNLEDIRYGFYGRIGYKWVALYYSYRLSNVFKETPMLPPMELGITVFL